MLERIGLLGATGFVGTHLLENWHLNQKAEVIPIVRSFSSLGKIARFSLDWRLADCTDTNSLAKALKGIDVLVHCASGDSATIKALVKPVYEACETAGVKRIVYLSSAAIFGQNLPTGTNDFSKIPHHHPSPYNAAKAQAEKEFFKLRSKGSTELVILRPSIVYGPRSRWIIEFIKRLLAGQACWLDEGKGIVNGIYIDNLLYAIERALLTKGEGQAFIVRDEHSYTWRQFYTPFVTGLGFELDAIQNLNAAPALEKTKLLHRIPSIPYLEKLKPHVPARMKRILKASLAAWDEPPSSTTWYLAKAPAPTIDSEMAALFANRWTLPQDKAKELLAYQPIVSHEQAVGATLEWLRFCGYPIRSESCFPFAS